MSDAQTKKYIHDKIITILTIYPILNNTMLQMGLTTTIKKSEWFPVLNDMIKSGLVIESSVPIESNGRFQVFKTLQLKKKPEATNKK